MTTKKRKNKEQLEIFQKLIIQFANRTQEDDLNSGKGSTQTGGSFTEREGTRRYRLRDERGVEEEFLREVGICGLVDVQSNSKTASNTCIHPVDSRAASIQATDQNLPIEARIDALRWWIAEDNDAAAKFIASELNENALTSEWRRIVIYATEAVRFATLEFRTQVALSLLRNAEELRHSSSADDTPVVMCAIRRAGSILPRQMFFDLSPLLSPPDPIDTRLVTLQAINTMFLSTPPENSDFGVVTERVAMIAQKHWDLDVFKAGEISAIAIEATVAAVVLGNKRTKALADCAVRTGRRLLIGKLKRRLEEVKRHWETASSNSSCLACLLEAISRLGNT
jgi:hypothetical protein